MRTLCVNINNRFKICDKKFAVIERGNARQYRRNLLSRAVLERKRVTVPINADFRLRNGVLHRIIAYVAA